MEAPKGQPMIRRENLEALCVEAPQGQPRNHRPPFQKTSRSKTNGRKGENVKTSRPTIITAEKSGNERRWGLLSRANAWRAGCFVEDMDGDARVFLEKDGSFRIPPFQNSTISEFHHFRIPLRIVIKLYFPFCSRCFSTFDPLPHFSFEKFLQLDP